MMGIPPADTAVCFIAEGLAMIYGLQPLQAVVLAQNLMPYAFELFKKHLAEQHGVDLGAQALSLPKVTDI
jgi:hypothetical protein